VGATVRVHVLDGERQVLEVPVGGVVDEMVGMSSYMELGALSRLLGQERTLTGATLSVDPLRQAELFTRLSELPMVIGVARTDQAREFFEERSARILLVTALVLAGFASVIAVGVVYNNARVALAVRARDLATLRVIGFTRREISTVLLGEMAVSLLLALPVGFVLGRWTAGWVAEASVDNELFSFTAIVSPATYAFAALVVLVSGLLSALLVRRRLDHLDLISVLKTRE
jgi:putative ABC transport system permease protein